MRSGEKGVKEIDAGYKSESVNTQLKFIQYEGHLALLPHDNNFDIWCSSLTEPAMISLAQGFVSGIEVLLQGSKKELRLLGFEVERKTVPRFGDMIFWVGLIND